MIIEEVIEATRPARHRRGIVKTQTILLPRGGDRRRRRPVQVHELHAVFIFVRVRRWWPRQLRGDVAHVVFLCGMDSVAKPPRPSGETRALSDGHVDGVEATRHRVDAIAATTSSSRSFSAPRH